jgi:hypothetical protein
MASDSLRAVHPNLPDRSVRIKKRALTRTQCRARPVRSPWNGGHRSNAREPSESLRVRYRMLVRALSDRQNGAFRKAFLTRSSHPKPDPCRCSTVVQRRRGALTRIMCNTRG